MATMAGMLQNVTMLAIDELMTGEQMNKVCSETQVPTIMVEKE